MRILITGGAGFVPSSLADALLTNKDVEVVLVDNFLTGRKENIPVHSRARFIKCDVNNYNEIAPIVTAFRFDYIFHYAAVVGVKRTLDNPVMVLNDIQGIKNILDLAKSTGVKRVFFSSSSEVYGEPVHLPQHEHTTPLNSRLPYAVVKNVGESFCRSYQQEFGLDFTLFRFFNTYGPKQSPDFVVARFIDAALAGRDITVYGDGHQTRSFCYVTDLVEGIEKLMDKVDIKGEIVNLGNPSEYTISELAHKITQMIDTSSQIVFEDKPADDPDRRKPDITKAKQLLNWEPKVPLEEGLQKTIEYFKQII